LKELRAAQQAEIQARRQAAREEAQRFRTQQLTDAAAAKATKAAKQARKASERQEQQCVWGYQGGGDGTGRSRGQGKWEQCFSRTGGALHKYSFLNSTTSSSYSGIPKSPLLLLFSSYLPSNVFQWPPLLPTA
jgi:hypothetical protein